MNKLQDKIKKMPDSPGIYLFYKDEELVYVGKATSLKNRAKSYLNPKTFRPIEAMIGAVTDVDWKETDSVLEAVILEANYIKKYKPKYNVKEKDDKSWNYLVVTKDEFPKLEAVRERNLKKEEYKYVFGPYAEMRISQILKILHVLFKVSRCSPSVKKPCFDYQLKHCLGVCTGEISQRDYRDKVINPLVMFLKGKKNAVLVSLNKKMKEASKMQDFEEAKRLRDQIFSLQKIRDFSLLDKSFLDEEKKEEKLKIKKIEGYDISNMGAEAKVGSMVVFSDKGPVKSEYKKFKIKTVAGQSDVDCLKEVFERRIRHSEWPLPDIILVDGGKPQIGALKKVLKESKIKIFIVGIAKGRERKKNELLFSEDDARYAEWSRRNIGLLVKVRDEAHRFAINYQRKLISKRITQ
jgi:excinuclease ABC subunit C